MSPPQRKRTTACVVPQGSFPVSWRMLNDNKVNFGRINSVRERVNLDKDNSVAVAQIVELSIVNVTGSMPKECMN